MSHRAETQTGHSQYLAAVAKGKHWHFLICHEPTHASNPPSLGEWGRGKRKSWTKSLMRRMGGRGQAQAQLIFTRTWTGPEAPGLQLWCVGPSPSCLNQPGPSCYIPPVPQSPKGCAELAEACKAEQGALVFAEGRHRTVLPGSAPCCGPHPSLGRPRKAQMFWE